MGAENQADELSIQESSYWFRADDNYKIGNPIGFELDSEQAHNRSVDALIFLVLKDDDVYVRIFAADSLFALNRHKLEPVWKQALEDESTYIIEVAEKALRNLRNYTNLVEAE